MIIKNCLVSSLGRNFFRPTLVLASKMSSTAVVHPQLTVLVETDPGTPGSMLPEEHNVHTLTVARHLKQIGNFKKSDR